MTVSAFGVIPVERHWESAVTGPSGNGPQHQSRGVFSPRLQAALASLPASTRPPSVHAVLLIIIQLIND